MNKHSKIARSYWERVARQLPILGKAGQEKIASMALSIIGSSGSGSHFIQQGALVGFTKMNLFDPDLVESSNRNRSVLAGQKDDGKHKVLVAKRKIQRSFPGMKVRAFPSDIRSPGIWEEAKKATWVIDATDNEKSKKYINEKCVQEHVPLISMGFGFVLDNGRLVHAGCRVNRVRVGDACLACQALGGDSQTNLTPASLVITNAITATLALDMLLREVTKYTGQTSRGEQTDDASRNANYVFFDLLDRTLTTMLVIPTPGCTWCKKLNSASK